MLALGLLLLLLLFFLKLLLHWSNVVAVVLKYCLCCFPRGVGRNSRGSNDYSCCSVPMSRIRTVRGRQSVFVAQMRCTCCARVRPTEAFLMSGILRLLPNSETSHVAGPAFSPIADPA